MANDLTSGQLDPEIADLMGIQATTQTEKPEFSDLFEEEVRVDKKGPDDVDLTRKSFDIQTAFEEKPKPYFRDKNYYKNLLADQGEIGRRVHQLLTQFATATDPKDKSVYRARLTTAYWELAGRIAARVSPDMPLSKRLLLRFGILSPTLISAEQRDVISRIIYANKTDEPVHYLDEWLTKIAQGAARPSATDEVKKARLDDNQKTVEIVEKRRGQRQAELSLLQNKIGQLDELEANLLNRVQSILRHHTRPEYGGLKDVFSPEQRDAISQVNTILRQLSNLDRDIKGSYNTLENMDEELRDLQEKADGVDMSVDRGVVTSEFQSLRQMSKMCVGRQGNHFPILMKQYFRPNIREICTRENVINAMAKVESLDTGVFERTFKGQTSRIVPYVLLLPNYGDTGICWEPFERYNRASSRGRVALPMFPKDVEFAVIYALADLRWQVAKEKAQHYWMEEGITGRYYQWFQEQRLRGDVKDYFIRDYILWIAKESQGTQKLEREVRGIFWRMMPFPQSIKDNLKNRGFVYNELYKKDVNISMSDGY
ncbi:MAG: hypothetical protein JSV89_22045 [Spirochaetaceae bacterium]|nr:MAG: hypothetical protein JSV89_22045 [Spirochaetaceae bacterium]